MDIKENFNDKNLNGAKVISPVKKIAISGVVMAIYILIMFLNQSFASLQVQIRVATSLYSLSTLYPFLILPLGLSNLLSNALMGGLGIFDTLGGLVVGLITASLTYLVKKFELNDWFIAVPIILGPGLIVPIWLSYITKIPYTALAISLCMGQVSPGILGVLLVKQLRNKVK